METFEVLKVVETVKVLFENHTRSSNIEKNCTRSSNIEKVLICVRKVNECRVKVEFPLNGFKI